MFKDKIGRWVTAGLFTETATFNKDFVIMSLDEAREKFVELRDPYGYEFSKLYLGGWQHWKAMEASTALSSHIQDWKDELEVALRVEGVKGIINNAGEGSYQAQKYLADKGFVNAERGRPSKAKIQQEANKLDKVKAQSVAYLNPLK